MIMVRKVKYFIAYYGEHAFAWDADKSRFVPYGMDLYTTFYDCPEDAMRELRKVRKEFSGWRDDIGIDSKLSYFCE